MRRYLKALILTLACFAVLAPFASTAPDGLEKVAETLGAKRHEPFWKGIMPDYSFPAIGNPYVSTILSGILGAFLVFGIAFVIGKTLTKTEKQKSPD
jgi:cobalt/nickel transport protein